MEPDLVRNPQAHLVPTAAPREVRAHPGPHRRRLSRQPLLQVGPPVISGMESGGKAKRMAHHIHAIWFIWDRL